MRKVPPMARSGILIHGLRKRTSFSWINRNVFLLLDTLKLTVSSIALVLVSPMLIMGKQSKQLRRQPKTFTLLFRSSSRHLRGSLEEHSISQENPTRFVHFSVSFKSLTQFYKGRYLPVFASVIIDRNQVAVREGRPTINLKSVLIGNGITDISTFVLHILASIKYITNIPQIIPRTI